MSLRKEGSKSYDWSHLYINEFTLHEPIDLQAEIVHGFRRGSKELGIPTANLSMEDLGEKGENLRTGTIILFFPHEILWNLGIYYGWITLNNQRYASVVSVGWNPFYKNVKKTVEAHVLHTLDDFYGEQVKLVLLGYLRDEYNFNGLGDHSISSRVYYTYLLIDELISCIQSDIKLTKIRLESNPKVVAKL